MVGSVSKLALTDRLMKVFTALEHLVRERRAVALN